MQVLIQLAVLTLLICSIVARASTIMGPVAAAAAAAASRISHGHAAAEKQFPYQVSISSQRNHENTYTIFAGSIINPSWTLTSARATKGFDKYLLRFGSVNRKEGGLTQTSTTAITHADQDIALISIPNALLMGPKYSAIRLASSGQLHADYYVNQKAVIGGWGKTESSSSELMLRWVHVRIVSNEECRVNVGVPTVILNANMCAIGYDSGGNRGGACNDVGGPLVIEENGIATQIGIFSFSRTNGCLEGYPGVYVRTVNFLDWIYGHTGISIRP